MLSSFFKHRILFLLLTALFVCGAPLASAQTTEFTYQGNLVDNSIPANGNYDFEFRLFAVSTAGTPIGTRTRLNVAVTNGGFTVRLDFLPAAFNGADRFLEIGVKSAGSPDPFTMLSPRQQITYAPYSFRSLNAETADTAVLAMNSNQLGGIVANQYVLTSDSRLSDARPPTGGSPNYIQNNPVLPQPANFNINGNGIIGANLTVNGLLNASLPPDDSSYIQNNVSRQSGIVHFNISGNGLLGGTLFAVGAINSSTQYNILGNRVLGIGGNDSLFVGVGAGANNMDDSFFGKDNSFFGRNAGNANTGGLRNSFFGRDAGLENTGGSFNSFFGFEAGRDNSLGDYNAYFGLQAGQRSNGSNNAYFGYLVGGADIGSGENAFFGARAGDENTTGRNNTFVGYKAGGLDLACPFVCNGNSTGSRNTFIGNAAGWGNTSGNNNTIIGSFADVSAEDLNHATAIGANATVGTSATIVLGRSTGDDTVLVPGKLQIDTLGTTGSDHLCINASNRVAACSSSLRYKTHLAPYRNGLDILNRLSPISFTWKDSGMRDVGFGAEDIEKINPLLVTYNKQGQVEGVKYDRINVVLVNAIKEQQKQIEELKSIKAENVELKAIKAENAQLKAQLAAMLTRLERLERKQGGELK